MSLTDDEMEKLARKAYEENLGKLVLASYVDGGVTYPDGREDFDSCVPMDPPILLRIVETQDDDVVRRGDKDHIDPYWEAEPVGAMPPGFRYIVLCGHTISREGVEHSPEWEEAVDAPILHEGCRLGYY
jgi:hypothetical protein